MPPVRTIKPSLVSPSLNRPVRGLGIRLVYALRLTPCDLRLSTLPFDSAVRLCHSTLMDAVVCSLCSASVSDAPIAGLQVTDAGPCAARRWQRYWIKSRSHRSPVHRMSPGQNNATNWQTSLLVIKKRFGDLRPRGQTANHKTYPAKLCRLIHTVRVWNRQAIALEPVLLLRPSCHESLRNTASTEQNSP